MPNNNRVICLASIPASAGLVPGAARDASGNVWVEFSTELGDDDETCVDCGTRIDFGWACTVVNKPEELPALLYMCAAHVQIE